MKDLAMVQGGLAALSVASAVATATIAASAAVIDGLGVSFSKFMTMGDDLQDSANRIGITTDRLQELTYAAGQSGAKMEDVERAILMAQRKGLDFDKVAAAIGAIEDPVKRNQAAFAAFGKAGAKIAPMLKDLGALSARARELGLVFRPEDVAMGGKMADMWGAIKAQIAGVFFQIGAAIAPVMEIVFTVTQEILAQVLKVMQGVTDAVVASNVPLAFEIVWTAALLEFERFRAELLANIGKLGVDMLKMAAQIGKGFARALLHGNFDPADFMKRLLKPGSNVKELESRLDRLIDKAAKEREEKFGPLGIKMPKLPKPPGGIGFQSGQMGTFSAAIAAIAGRTGQLSVEQKQLDALKGIEEDMAIIRTKAEEGGLVFA